MWLFWTEFGPILTDLGRCWPKVANIGRSSADFGQVRPNFGEDGPYAAEFSPNLAEFGCIWLKSSGRRRDTART